MIDWGKFEEFARDYMARVDAALNNAFFKAYPDHDKHGGCDEKEVIYFDALMTAVRVQCTCGDVLDIDRDFFTADELKQSRLP